MGVPLLDVAQLQAGPESRKAYLQDLVQSFQDYGFVRLRNHGVPAKRVQQIFNLAGDVFSLDSERKSEFANIADGSPQRGYSAMGVEKTASLHGKLVGREVDEKLTDAREHFDCGSPLDKAFVNRWPTNNPVFRTELEAFYFEMEQVTAGILGSLEEALGCPTGTFNKLITHENNASELRLNHYPSIPASVLREGQVARIWPHFDLGVITLLFTSAVGGLEVEDRKAAEPHCFIPVEPETEAELIVNISETLQRWSDDQLPAGLHRVTMPKKIDGVSIDGKDPIIPGRYSIAYLCKADREASVGTLPDLQTGDEPRYTTMTASEYHRLRLLTAY